MGHKRLLTERLVQSLPEEYLTTVDEALVQWFLNIREDGGLRLTELGFTTLTHCLKLEFYLREFTDPLRVNQRTLIALDNKLKMPYFIVYQKKLPVAILLFSEREAFAITMYGNLDRFLELYA